MIEYVLLGCGLAFSAAIQPGPLQTYLFSRVAANGWKRTLPAAMAPVFSDIPIALVVLLVLGQVSVMVQQYLRITGGVLLLYFAWSTFRQLHHSPGTANADTNSAPRTIVQAALVNIFNPNPYLGWALVIGPALVGAWHLHRTWAISLLVAFYATMVLTLAAFIFLLGATKFLSPRTRKTLIWISGFGLAALGIQQLTVSIFTIVAA